MARQLPDSGWLIQHIPRTGGTWVERALDALGIPTSRWIEKQPRGYPKKHALLSHYFRPDLPQVERIAAFVRHPFPYYASVWKYFTKMGKRRRRKHFFCPGTKYQTWHPHYQAWLTYVNDFNRWVLRMTEEFPCWYTRLVDLYVGPPRGEFTDFIGRTETLEADLLDLLREAGYGKYIETRGHRLADLKRWNSIPERVEWTDEATAAVLASERSVVARFYDKDSRDRRWYGPALEPTIASAIIGTRKESRACYQ